MMTFLEFVERTSSLPALPKLPRLPGLPKLPKLPRMNGSVDNDPNSGPPKPRMAPAANDSSVAPNDRAAFDAGSAAFAGIGMQSKIYDHVLTLKITAAMREQIDEALARMKDSTVQTRSEFLRMAAAYSLSSILEGYSTLSIRKSAGRGKLSL